MKTGISILFFAFLGFIGFVKFEETSIPMSEPKAWQPSYDGVMEINSLKVKASKEFNRCKVEQSKIKNELSKAEKVVDTLE